jgi:hypothetical protein
MKKLKKAAKKKTGAAPERLKINMKFEEATRRYLKNTLRRVGPSQRKGELASELGAGHAVKRPACLKWWERVHSLRAKGPSCHRCAGLLT